MADGETPPDGSIAIPVIEQDGTQYVPVFTSEEALRSAGADPEPAVGLPLADLAANWPSEELWLAVDPGSENGLSLPPQAVQALASYAQGPGGEQSSIPDAVVCWSPQRGRSAHDPLIAHFCNTF